MNQEELDQNLFHACICGVLGLAERAIQEGANVNAKDKRGYTPLHWAANSGYLNISKYLVKEGANVNAKDNGGNTPLHLAASNGPLRLDVVKFLVENGADLYAKDNGGWTPLYCAAFCRCTEVAEYLKQVMESKPIQHNVKCGNFEISIHIKQIGT